MIVLKQITAIVASAVVAVHFPGPSHISLSPNARYAIVWHEAHPENNLPHRLSLVDERTQDILALLSFERWVDVLWSPTGRYVAITDHAGSDTASLRIFDMRSPKSPTLLDEKMPPIVQKLEFDAHHRYIEATGWRSSSALRVRARGYGGRTGEPSREFRRYVVCSGVRDWICE